MFRVSVSVYDQGFINASRPVSGGYKHHRECVVGHGANVTRRATSGAACCRHSALVQVTKRITGYRHDDEATISEARADGPTGPGDVRDTTTAVSSCSAVSARRSRTRSCRTTGKEAKP